MCFIKNGYKIVYAHLFYILSIMHAISKCVGF